MQEMQETRVGPLGQEDSLKEEMASHSSILAWRIPGQRNLAVYSPWGSKKSDMTEVTEQARRHIVLCIGGGVKGSYMGTLQAPK